MSHIPELNARKLRDLLHSDGWAATRQSGSHEQYQNARKPGRVVTVCWHGNGNVPFGTAKSILESAGLGHVLRDLRSGQSLKHVERALKAEALKAG